MKKFLQVLFTVGISVASGYIVTHMIMGYDNATPLMFWGLLAFSSLFFFTFIGGWSNSFFDPYGLHYFD
ncbi:MAG: hypothetical protein K2H53_04370 [Clostridia bacterium]|nr:hypothetical protein [Clostridia bacterium]